MCSTWHGGLKALLNQMGKHQNTKSTFFVKGLILDCKTELRAQLVTTPATIQSKVVTKGVSHGSASSGGEGVKAKLKKLGLSDESDTSEDEETVEKRILDRSGH